MQIPTEVIAVSGACYLWSVYLSYKVALVVQGKWWKLGAFFLLLFPIIGPFLYFFVYEQPPLNRYKHRRHKVRPIASYDNEFEIDALRMKKLIREAEERFKDEFGEDGKP